MVLGLTLVCVQVLRRRMYGKATSPTVVATDAAANASSPSITKGAEIGYDQFLKLVDRKDGVVRAVEVGNDLIHFRIKRGGHHTKVSVPCKMWLHRREGSNERRLF